MAATNRAADGDRSPNGLTQDALPIQRPAADAEPRSGARPARTPARSCSPTGCRRWRVRILEAAPASGPSGLRAAAAETARTRCGLRRDLVRSRRSRRARGGGRAPEPATRKRRSTARSPTPARSGRRRRDSSCTRRAIDAAAAHRAAAAGRSRRSSSACSSTSGSPTEVSLWRRLRRPAARAADPLRQPTLPLDGCGPRRRPLSARALPRSSADRHPARCTSTASAGRTPPWSSGRASAAPSGSTRTCRGSSASLAACSTGSTCSSARAERERALVAASETAADAPRLRPPRRADPGRARARQRGAAPARPGLPVRRSRATASRSSAASTTSSCGSSSSTASCARSPTHSNRGASSAGRSARSSTARSRPSRSEPGSRPASSCAATPSR